MSVKNNRTTGALPNGRLGPLPTRTTRTGRPMSESRVRLLETLEGQPEPATLAALAAATGLHPNTLRQHLEALERQGLVVRTRAAARGRGRPAWLYEAVSAAGPGESEYAGLAAALAAAIDRSSSSPRADAEAAGEEWGRELARDRSRPPLPGAAAARRQVVALLSDVGFAPETDRSHRRVRLTRCPLLEAAHKHPDIVCGVHVGLVRGALEEYGAAPTGVQLQPFAEPGACRLGMHLPDLPDER
jgi:predicted ArsR family transcriptional regulator